MLCARIRSFELTYYARICRKFDVKKIVKLKWDLHHLTIAEEFPMRMWVSINRYSELTPKGKSGFGHMFQINNYCKEHNFNSYLQGRNLILRNPHFTRFSLSTDRRFHPLVNRYQATGHVSCKSYSKFILSLQSDGNNHVNRMGRQRHSVNLNLLPSGFLTSRHTSITTQSPSTIMLKALLKIHFTHFSWSIEDAYIIYSNFF